MGVAEWRLKINQPSLFQFVRKQKWREIMKREREMGGGLARQGQSAELALARQRAGSTIVQRQPANITLKAQKGKGFLQVLFV